MDASDTITAQSNSEMSLIGSLFIFIASDSILSYVCTGSRGMLSPIKGACLRILA